MNLLPRQDSLKPEYNPKGLYRPGQLATVVSLFGAIHDGYKFLALNAPTGSGKSIIATSLANLLGGSHILTTQIKLQEQYLELGEDYKRVLGRGNFPCKSSHNHRTANQGLCIEGKSCQYRPQKKGDYEAFNEQYWRHREINKRCEYWKNVEIGVNSKHTIFNYAYYVLKMNSTSRDFPKKPLMILDEGHNLESTVRNIASFEIHDMSLRYISPHLTVPKLSDCEGSIKWMKEILSEVEICLLEVSDEHEKTDTKRRMHLSSLKDKLTWTIEKYSKKPENWVFYNLETGIKLSPLFVGEYIYDILFSHSDVRLIMSATLPNKKVLCKRLGIKEKEMFYYNQESTFPPENSPIHTYSQPTMTWEKDMNPKRDVMGKKILDFMKKHDSRGLILVNSFNELIHYANYIYDKDKKQYKRLTQHNRGDRQEYLIADHQRKKGSVLISPSMWEGVDLVGDLAEFLLICKVPYSDYKDPIVQGWKELDPKRYFEDTVQKIRQGVGRVVRSPEDKAEIHILDGNFKRLYRYNKKEFPKDFRERVI